ncbi:MAG: TIGR03620 family F420-dependent LLM class oxidoreductase, partial [Candidatus Dormibacteraeota bacterium]|nr:TIGR03620 family F420-dependent LLM class oxidoreductase [Candidatus Dormibacteraeota bacterium]
AHTTTRANVDLGRAAVWLGSMAFLRTPDLRRAIAEVEEMGFGAIWVGESLAREAFAASAIILAATSRIKVATGIANIWARDPTAMMNGGRALAEAWPNRFVLGIGVSHAGLVNDRGHQYERPLTAMRAYLDQMEKAPYRAPEPDLPVPIVLGALGPKMLQLAGERTAGAHPYFVPVEHTLEARRILGPDRLLAPEQAVVFAKTREAARLTGDIYMRTYLRLPNYRNNLVRLGWSDDDLTPPGSDPLFDAIVAWGDDEEIARKLRRHQEAGANQVAVSVLTPTTDRAPTAELRRLAPLLLS